MTVLTFLMHAFYIGAPLAVGFYLGMRYASRQTNKLPLEVEKE